MRHSYGEGSVYRKGRGWEAALLVHGRRRTARAKTSREAREKLRQLQRKADEDAFVQDERMTTGDYLEYWLTIVETTVRASTHKRYSQYVRVHAVPEIGRVRLTQLKPMHLQQLYANRLRAGAAPSTVQHLHATLHRALAMAERWDQPRRPTARHRRRHPRRPRDRHPLPHTRRHRPATHRRMRNRVHRRSRPPGRRGRLRAPRARGRRVRRRRRRPRGRAHHWRAPTSRRPRRPRRYPPDRHRPRRPPHRSGEHPRPVPRGPSAAAAHCPTTTSHRHPRRPDAMDRRPPSRRPHDRRIPRHLPHQLHRCTAPLDRQHPRPRPIDLHRRCCRGLSPGRYDSRSRSKKPARQRGLARGVRISSPPGATITG
jgi:hypothetical protein